MNRGVLCSDYQDCWKYRLKVSSHTVEMGGDYLTSERTKDIREGEKDEVGVKRD